MEKTLVLLFVGLMFLIYLFGYSAGRIDKGRER